jgi:hypothetical protein
MWTVPPAIPHLAGSFNGQQKWRMNRCLPGISIENTQFSDKEIWLPDVRDARAFQSDISNRRSALQH